MVIILRTLLFPVDNGMGTGLSGEGYSAEYDLWTGKVRWRKAAEGSISKQQELTFRLLVYLPYFLQYWWQVCYYLAEIYFRGQKFYTKM